MYSARIDGKPTIFGTSGMLYRSNKLMYDRRPKRCGVHCSEAPYRPSGASRRPQTGDIPPWLPRYGVEWLAEHPDTSVLSPLNDFYRPIVYPQEDYYKSTYYRYRTIPNTMFPVWNRDSRLGTKAGVLGVSISDSHIAYTV